MISYDRPNIFNFIFQISDWPPEIAKIHLAVCQVSSKLIQPAIPLCLERDLLKTCAGCIKRKMGKKVALLTHSSLPQRLFVRNNIGSSMGSLAHALQSALRASSAQLVPTLWCVGLSVYLASVK